MMSFLGLGPCKLVQVPSHAVSKYVKTWKGRIFHLQPCCTGTLICLRYFTWIWNFGLNKHHCNIHYDTRLKSMDSSNWPNWSYHCRLSNLTCMTPSDPLQYYVRAALEFVKCKFRNLGVWIHLQSHRQPALESTGILMTSL